MGGRGRVFMVGTVLLLFALLLTGCVREKRRTPALYLIPQGYVGWVLVEYGVKGAPPLRSEAGFKLFPIPQGGHLVTSSPGPDTGWATDRYVSVDSSGRRSPLNQTLPGRGGMIWGGSFTNGRVGVLDGQKSCEVQTPPREAFFVGMEVQYRANLRAAPTNDPRSVAAKVSLVCP